MNDRDVTLAVFVKTPSRSPIKTRLAAAVGVERAEEFYRRSLRCVLDVVRAAQLRCQPHGFSLVPYWAVAEPDALGDPLWNDFESIEQGTGGLGARLHQVYEWLRRRSSRIAFLGADLPQLAPETLVETCRRLGDRGANDPPRFLVGRVNDGGFSLFAGNAELPSRIWTDVAYSQSTTADELIAGLREFGEVLEFSLGDDVDTLADLQAVLPPLESPAALSEQRSLAAWVREWIPEN